MEPLVNDGRRHRRRYGEAMKLWSLEDVAEYASYGLTVARKMVAQPDFPRPIRVFNGAHPRWEAEEVIEWMRSRKEAA